MPHASERTSLDSLPEEELKALAERSIEKSNLVRAKRRAYSSPAIVKQYFQEPEDEIEMNDRLVARALAEEIFERYMRRLETTQPPDPPPGNSETSDVPEA